MNNFRFVTAVAIGLFACSAYAGEYHVAKTGHDANPGSESKPFSSISAAAQIAQPGDFNPYSDVIGGHWFEDKGRELLICIE